MTDQFLAEIRIFPYTFAPNGWALCNGQLLPISQNTALFSLLGTNFGGDGLSTFGLPNLQGSAPLHQGQGPGLSFYSVGYSGGSQAVTLLDAALPGHTHTLEARAGRGVAAAAPAAGDALGPSAGGPAYGGTTGATGLSVGELSPAGGSQPHNNLMPFLVFTFCISMVGIYPARS